MTKQIQNRMQVIDLLANGDHVYFAMLKELRTLERCYDAVLSAIPPEQRDILCDYLSLCEEMSHRKLELACTYMRFPE